MEEKNLYRGPSGKGPRIVAIGGGTGLSTMLRGLKKHTKNLTAIVTVADDGGGSGVLRQELGMLPPGDTRNCLEALAKVERVMSELFHYRFTEGSPGARASETSFWRPSTASPAASTRR